MQSIGIFAEQQNNSVTFSLPNRLVESNSERLLAAIEPYLPSYKRFIVDLSQTDQIDPVGLGCFLVLKEKVMENGGEVTLLNPQGQVLQLLDRANFSQLFQVEYSEGTYDI